jgi:hypothetical protein
MGLDSFRTDNNDSSESDEGSESDSNNETSTEDEVTGIEAFRTSETDPTKKKNKEDDEDLIFGVTPSEWNRMDAEEQVKHVRDNHVEDYRPDFHVDGDWSFSRIVEIECVCDNYFTFQTRGVCLNCGRVYKDAGRTVTKVEEANVNRQPSQ